jgi:hypothetical protein
LNQPLVLKKSNPEFLNRGPFAPSIYNPAYSCDRQFRGTQNHVVHTNTCSRNPREAPIYEAHDNKETGRLRMRPLQEEQDEVRRFEAMQKVHPLWKGTVVCSATQIFDARSDLHKRVYPRDALLEPRFRPFGFVFAANRANWRRKTLRQSTNFEQPMALTNRPNLQQWQPISLGCTKYGIFSMDTKHDSCSESGPCSFDAASSKAPTQRRRNLPCHTPTSRWSISLPLWPSSHMPLGSLRCKQPVAGPTRSTPFRPGTDPRTPAAGDPRHDRADASSDAEARSPPRIDGGAARPPLLTAVKHLGPRPTPAPLRHRRRRRRRLQRRPTLAAPSLPRAAPLARPTLGRRHRRRNAVRVRQARPPRGPRRPRQSVALPSRVPPSRPSHPSHPPRSLTHPSASAWPPAAPADGARPAVAAPTPVCMRIRIPSLSRAASLSPSPPPFASSLRLSFSSSLPPSLLINCVLGIQYLDPCRACTLFLLLRRLSSEETMSTRLKHNLG